MLAAASRSDGLDAIRQDLAGVKAAVRRTRREHNFYFSPGRKLRGWAVGSLAVAAAGGLVFAQVVAAKILPYAWIATPLTLSLFGSAETGICELYKHAHDLEHCLVPNEKGGKR